MHIRTSELFRLGLGGGLGHKMSQNVTLMVNIMTLGNGNADSYQLDAKQAKALDLLLMGKTVTEAAREIGVSRETVSRWRHKDPAFQAAYNAAMKSSWEACQAKLMKARLRAFDKLLEMIDSKDEEMAYKVCLMLIRLNINEPTGRVDPKWIDNTQRIMDRMEY